VRPGAAGSRAEPAVEAAGERGGQLVQLGGGIELGVLAEQFGDGVGLDAGQERCPLFTTAAFDELGERSGVVPVVPYVVEVERIPPRDVVGHAVSPFCVTVLQRVWVLTCDVVPTTVHAADTIENLCRLG
jgi:hypothetical protein